MDVRLDDTKIWRTIERKGINMNAEEARVRVAELIIEQTDAQSQLLSWIKQKIDAAVEDHLAYSVDVSDAMGRFPRAQLAAAKTYLEDTDRFVVTVNGTGAEQTVRVSWDTI